ncbi:MAG: hypothetical protein R3C97_06340 [Geminicoccaceae bacterium]
MQPSIYTYAWDLAELGPVEFAAELRSLGLKGITLACSYHAGKFMRPHGRHGRIYFPEDGTVYFRHRAERYGRLEPLRWSGVDDFDPLAQLTDHAPDLARTAWVVCCHNSRLGALHPDHVARNCFGDRYIYSLNPAHPEVREYVVALCRDLAEQYDLDAMVLETPGWLPYAHGYHHEFAMRAVDPWLAHGLGLCFAPESLAGAKAAGIDAEALRERLARSLDIHLAGGLALDDARAAEWLHADFVEDPDWTAFHRWRQGAVTSLVAEIRDALPSKTRLRVIPSVRRPTAGAWREGSDLAGLARAGDGLEICAYEPDAHAVALDVQDVRRRIGEAPLSAVIRPSYPDLGDGNEVAVAAAHLRAAGVDGLSFYNYGHLDRPSLARIRTALEAFS